MVKNKEKFRLLQYVGDMSQIFGTKDYTLNGGKASSVHCVDVKNSKGLELTVIPDRCMDIGHLSYKGINFSYIAKAGIVSPQYFDDRGNGFLRSFFAGFLTTCGLTYCGAACKDGDEELGLHGRISNTPAEEFGLSTVWEGNQAVMKLRGIMREARLFGENLILTREITVRHDENRFLIRDTVENLGFEPKPLMILYHFNLGYPLLTEESFLVTKDLEVRPRNDTAKKGIGQYDRMHKPTPGYEEQVFYHDLKPDKNGNVSGALINPALQLGIVIRFNKNQLKLLTQWKQMGEGDYALGIEPCNSTLNGRDKAREDGTLETIRPGEIRKFNIEAEILDGPDDIKRELNLLED